MKKRMEGKIFLRAQIGNMALSLVSVIRDYSDRQTQVLTAYGFADEYE